jgi:hypothetical protein
MNDVKSVDHSFVIYQMTIQAFRITLGLGVSGGKGV